MKHQYQQNIQKQKDSQQIKKIVDILDKEK